MNEKCRLLQVIYETGFALDDAALYLDTHPCDPEAIQFFETTRNYYRKAVADYTSQFGPLSQETARFTAPGSDGCGCNRQNENFNRQNENLNCWNWVQDPWPWEGDEF